MPGPHLERAANGFYYVHWTEGRRSRRESTRCKTLGDATGYLKGFIAAREGITAESAAAALTVADLFAAYRERHVVPNCASTVNADKTWKVLGPHFGALSVKSVDNDCAERYRATRARRGVKDSSVRRELAQLVAILNWAADPHRKLIAKADVQPILLPAAAEPRDRWLTTVEIGLLLDTARKRRENGLEWLGQDPTRLSNVERFLWIGLQTAARQQAIIDLTWDRVDFETGMIDFNVPGRRSTKKRRAAVPMSTALREVLQQAYAERRGPYVLETRTKVWMQLTRVAKVAGVAGVSPHVLRHTAATHMARRGVPLFHVAGVLGNTVGMVEKVYAKHAPGALAEAVEKIGMPAHNAQIVRASRPVMSADIPDISP